MRSRGISKAAGIAIQKIVPAQDIDCEDDSIHVTDKIHVQVSSIGDAYISVSKWTDEETMIAYPERLRIVDVVADIKKAMCS